MSIKWNKFAEVPQITVKLVGLKHWEVRALWFILERDALLQRTVCYFGPYDGVVVPLMSVSGHRRRFSREAVLRVMLAAPIAQENGFVFIVPSSKKPCPVAVAEKKKIRSRFETLYFSGMAASRV